MAHEVNTLLPGFQPSFEIRDKHVLPFLPRLVEMPNVVTHGSVKAAKTEGQLVFTSATRLCLTVVLHASPPWDSPSIGKRRSPGRSNDRQGRGLE